MEKGAEVIYKTNTATFTAIVEGRLKPQQAFFEQRIEIRGDVEMGLKLAVLFDQFLKENPAPQRREAMDALLSGA